MIFQEDESRKRREILARRPSYRKILNDLSSTEAAGTVSAGELIKAEQDDGDRGDHNPNTATITVATGTPYLKVLPAGAIQLATGSQDGQLQGLPTLTMTNAGGGTTGTIVQYAAQGQDGQFYVPGNYGNTLIMHTKIFEQNYSNQLIIFSFSFSITVLLNLFLQLIYV